MRAVVTLDASRPVGCARMLLPVTRPIQVRITGTKEEKAIEFTGKPIEVR